MFALRNSIIKLKSNTTNLDSWNFELGSWALWEGDLGNRVCEVSPMAQKLVKLNTHKHLGSARPVLKNIISVPYLKGICTINMI